MKAVRFTMSDESIKRVQAMMDTTSLKTMKAIVTNGMLLLETYIRLTKEGKQCRFVSIADPTEVTTVDMSFEVTP